MYLGMIVLLMVILPIGSIAAEMVIHGGSLIVLAGKWLVFWAVGIRLILAGCRQTINPAFTAQKIFEIKDPAALVIVQELGFANLSIGLLGILSIFERGWVVPAAVVGGLFYGLAGFKHLLKGDRNKIENIAMISDLFIFLVLAAYLAAMQWA
ncbi:hypothetical protein DTW90_10530 [Neorhizobium sp. P12A]|uniref:DUF6790 family protein n=1 Tax=Neorhizobium sp. P12A TaxID=2268027 RepID=UPI0011ECB88D|nr:DUF6790 family protein [Neorhizobium sp. P12A]KAA0700100.1 hypothetical protein DTW90_10530 [Neorhizobium sp. P12A]